MLPYRDARKRDWTVLRTKYVAMQYLASASSNGRDRRRSPGGRAYRLTFLAGSLLLLITLLAVGPSARADILKINTAER